MLATVSYDETVRIWNVASGLCLAVLQDFQGVISDITWIDDADGHLLATSCHDGSVRMWKVTGDGDGCQVQMRWGSDNNALVVTGANIQDADGMSELNNRLLQQRGAAGHPSRRSRDASKKMMTIASVVSKFQKSSDRLLGEQPSDKSDKL
jgi:WD40 repeat protein